MQHSRIALRVVLKWDTWRWLTVVNGHSGTQIQQCLFPCEDIMTVYILPLSVLYCDNTELLTFFMEVVQAFIYSIYSIPAINLKCK